MNNKLSQNWAIRYTSLNWMLVLLCYLNIKIENASYRQLGTQMNITWAVTCAAHSTYLQGTEGVEYSLKSGMGVDEGHPSLVGSCVHVTV